MIHYFHILDDVSPVGQNMDQMETMPLFPVEDPTDAFHTSISTLKEIRPLGRKWKCLQHHLMRTPRSA